MKKNILIADGQTLTAQGLQCLLANEQEWNVLEKSVSFSELKARLRLYKIDLLILDPTMLLGIKISDLGLLKNQYPEMEILLIVNENHLPFVKDLLVQPITGFITKTCGNAEIIKAVEAVLQQQKFYCHKVLEEVLENKKDMDLPQNCEPSILSDRELEVVKLVASGYKTLLIAEKLNLSVHTINTHRKNILKKLELKSPAELVRFGVSNNLV